MPGYTISSHMSLRLRWANIEEISPKFLKSHIQFKICISKILSISFMHQLFVTTAPPPPPPRDGLGIAGLMCRAVIFWVPPQCRVSAGLVILRKYTNMEFTIIKSRGRGAVVTNDWCITVHKKWLVHYCASKLESLYCNDPKFSDRQD